MFTFAHLIYGLIMIGLGIVGLKYNYQIVGFTGRQDWIESKLGSGSTYLGYKLFALLLIVIGFLLAVGLMNPVMNAIFGPLKGIFGGGSQHS
jgi:hypothetical protein